MNATVCVVGAGIAGLTAAFRLAQRGFRVTVFEQNEQVGGRMTERRQQSFVCRTGARLIYSFPGELQALVDELGLRSRVVTEPHVPMSCIDLDEEYEISLGINASALRTSALPRRERLRLALLAAPLLQARLSIDPHRIGSARAFDENTMADDLLIRVGPEFTDRWVEPAFRGARNWNAADVSPSFLYTTAAHSIAATHPFSFKSGIGELVEALAARLDVRLRSRILRINVEDQSCSLSVLADGGSISSMNYDYVVCAVEGPVAASIVDSQSPAVREFLDCVRFNSVAIVHYLLNRDLPSQRKFFTRRGGWRLGLYEQVSAGHSRSGLPVLYCQAGPELTSALAPVGGRGADRILRPEVSKLLPTLQQDVDDVFEQWIEHMLPIPYPGYASAVSRFEARVDAVRSRVVYCGDYLSQALVTGACESGARAADRLSRQWLGP